MITNQPSHRRRQFSDGKVGEYLSRRRLMGAVTLAIIALATLLFRRATYDGLHILATETIVGAIGMIVAITVGRSRSPGQTSDSPLSVTALLAVMLLPWVMDRVARTIGYGNGVEILMLTSLAWGGIACAGLARTSRTVGLSVVCSGFLTLFTTFISDSAVATIFAYSWGGLCLWWLVSNHWEQVAACSATRVQALARGRLIVMTIGATAFLLGTLLVSNRIPVIRKLRAEVMPTSGGTGSTDMAARRGLGNGEALVAAKQHATSFGAVETDVFLDSEKPSLFDVFSEEFGEPRKNKRVEQTQALSPTNIMSEQEKVAETNRSSRNDTFSTDREMPNQGQAGEDLESDALMMWVGESAAHLALERYEYFDGVDWHPSADLHSFGDDSGQTPMAIQLDEETWFKVRDRWVQNSLSPFIGQLTEALKFTRFRSATIPTRAGLQLWNIDQITREDFFSVSSSECLLMPDREHVPDYTVVRFINSRIDLERLEELARTCSPGQAHSQLSPECTSAIAALAHRYVGKLPRGWDQISAVIEGLRRDFIANATLEDGRSAAPALQASSTPIQTFLEQRTGPSYMFATTAALMLKHLGYRTRLVTGFYVNPTNRLPGSSEFAILPQDAHVWLEINVGHGYWIPLEPTPGFRQPQYRASVWYRLFKVRQQIAMGMAILVIGICTIFFLRRWLFEAVCRLVWPIVALLNQRQQATWLTWVLDIRCRLAGIPRAAGTTLREHFRKQLVEPGADVAQALEEFLVNCDRLWFGGSCRFTTSHRRSVRQVWLRLTIRNLLATPIKQASPES
jgi:transglutaminase-like putative cysteine protease